MYLLLREGLPPLAVTEIAPDMLRQAEDDELEIFDITNPHDPKYFDGASWVEIERFLG